MKKLSTVAVMLVFCASAYAQAEQAAKAQAESKAAVSAPADKNAAADNKSWFQDTLKGLRSKVGRRFQSTSVRVSAVAAVRGANMSNDAAKPYWKDAGSGKAAKKHEAQREELSKAIELVVNGKDAEGKAALEAFIKNNPDSPFVADAQEALVKLGGSASVPAASVAAPAKAESAPAPVTAPVEPAKPAVTPAPAANTEVK